MYLCKTTHIHVLVLGGKHSRSQQRKRNTLLVLFQKKKGALPDISNKHPPQVSMEVWTGIPLPTYHTYIRIHRYRIHNRVERICIYLTEIEKKEEAIYYLRFPKKERPTSDPFPSSLSFFILFPPLRPTGRPSSDFYFYYYPSFFLSSMYCTPHHPPT